MYAPVQWLSLRSSPYARAALTDKKIAFFRMPGYCLVLRDSPGKSGMVGKYA